MKDKQNTTQNRAKTLTCNQWKAAMRKTSTGLPKWNQWEIKRSILDDNIINTIIYSFTQISQLMSPVSLMAWLFHFYNTSHLVSPNFFSAFRWLPQSKNKCVYSHHRTAQSPGWRTMFKLCASTQHLIWILHFLVLASQIRFNIGFDDWQYAVYMFLL